MDQLSPLAQIARRPALTDGFGRAITYLRVSLTDRCNLRCFYCMGKEVKFLPKAEVLSHEEMDRLCAAFIRLGVRKLRLTGGEPLVRHGVMSLIERLGARVAAGELDELTLTTNGTLLAKYAPALAAAGVRRVNVSLDTLDAATFSQITQRPGLADVLGGIDAARSAGLAVRINAVALAGINDAGFDSLIRWCGEHGCDLALIERMPLGGMPAAHYLSLDAVRRELAQRWTLTPADGDAGSGGPCRYWKVLETGRRVGFITPLSHGFCSDCNRVRVTCTGALVMCMAQPGDIDLRAALRGGATDEGLEAAIIAAIKDKPVGHQFNLGEAPGASQRMWQLGG
ncbi:MAG: moaA [Proteobacteria bacterium]|nr:moaA [Pseudomonadota bacterium]